jgi:hypothetical protein
MVVNFACGTQRAFDANAIVFCRYANCEQRADAVTGVVGTLFFLCS